MNAGGQFIVVINKREIANDLLDRRASIYSDRPPNIVGSEIMAGGLLFGFSRYSDTYVMTLIVGPDFTLTGLIAGEECERARTRP